MAVLKIYNDIQTEEEQNACEFWGEVEGVTFKDVDEFVAGIPKGDNKIEIRLFCDGGSVSEGWAIYDKLRATGKEITAIVEGKAASMATVILMAAPQERRKAYASAEILVHNPYVPGWWFSGKAMDADELEKYAKELRRDQQKILDLYVERCGCDRDEMQALMDEDKFIGVERAKELGIIGEIIAPASAKSKRAMFNNKNKNQMAKEKKVEVRASLLDKVLAKLGVKSIEDVVLNMDLSTADGQTLTVEREEGEPQVGDKASPDGTFVMPDGKTIVVEDGVITDIQTGTPTDGEGGEGTDPEGEGDKTVEELQQRIEELEARIAELEEQLEGANAKAKTKDELRILNAVKIAGGEKALAKLYSSYKPDGRQTTGKQAAARAGERNDEPMSAMRAELEARRNGTFKKDK